MIDLDFFLKLSFYSNFGTRSLNVLELRKNIFCPDAIIEPVNIEESLINENWPRFSKKSNINFSVNSRLVPCILSKLNVKPTGILKLFCEHPNITWEHVNNIPSRQ